MNTDVVIIGAGAAGLAATKVLNSNGISNIVLEASDRIGGRAFTGKTVAGHPFDLGAHWMHYGDYLNPFTRYGLRNDIPFSVVVDPYPSEKPYLLYDRTLPAGNNLLPETEARDFYKKESLASDDLWWNLKNKGQNPSDLSPHDDLDATASKYAPWLGTIALTMGNWDMAKDWVDFSNNDYQRSPGYNGRPDFLCKQGYGALLGYSARNVKPAVQLNTNVTEVFSANGGVTVKSNKGTLTAKACIVTVSTGAIKAGLDEEQNSLVIKCMPEHLKSAFEKTTMGRFERVVFAFDRDVFGKEEHQYALFKVDNINNGRPEGFVFTTNLFGSDLVYADVGGKYAENLINSGRDALIAAATLEIKEMLGNNVTTHLVQNPIATDWTNNPLILGAYASPLPGNGHQREILKEEPPVDDVIFFAGEACHTSEWATVSGAHKSGCLVAMRISNRLNGSPQEEIENDCVDPTEYHCDRANISDEGYS